MAKPQNEQANEKANDLHITPAGDQPRSEGLLPTGNEDDGRFEVAEEVSLDQQSDALRHVGQVPELPTGGKAQA